MIEDNLILATQIKQPELMHHFMDLVAEDRLSHAYLMVGEFGAGENEIAKVSAMRIFCQNVQDNLPCGECFECVRILNNEHPDVVEIKPDGQSIKIDQIRYIKSEFSKSGVEGSRKIFIINNAEAMTVSAANSLLKFIEEPVGNTTIFLISREKNQILPTIVSRTQVIEFPKINSEQLKAELIKNNILPNQINLLLSITNDLNEILVWKQDDWFEKLNLQIANWFKYLSEGDLMAFTLIQSDLMPLISNKDQQNLTIEIILELFREVLELKTFEDDQELKFNGLLSYTSKLANKLAYPQIVNILEIVLSLKKYQQINVNFQNIIEATTLKISEVIES